MSFHIANLLEDSRTLDVSGATVVYNPQALTVGDFERLQAVEQGDWSAMIDMLARVIVSWDLEDDAGPIPLTPDGIRRLPLAIVNAIMEAVEGDSEPSDAEGKDSFGGSKELPSDSTHGPPASPNGGESSRQHVTSVSPPGTSPASPAAG